MNPATKKAILVSSVTLALAANAQASLVNDVLGPYAWSSDSVNFTLLTPDGATFPPGYSTNDVNMLWDGSAYNASSDYAGPGGTANVTASSTTPWFGSTYTMHSIQMFLPGTYSFDTALGGGNLETGMLNVTVGTGQLGMHMLWDWHANFNMDIFVVFAQNSIFGSGIARSTAGTDTNGVNNCDAAVIVNCLYDGPGYGSDGPPAGDTAWMLTSVDGDGDGVMGIAMMPSGPVGGHSWNINANLMPVIIDPIPIPAAAWLFGSGLLGLFGAARRKKKSSRV